MVPSAVRARVFAALCSSLVVLAASAAGAAGEAGASLDYQTAPTLADCPSAAAFRADIARQLGGDPFRGIARHRLVVRLFPTGARMEGRVEWRDANDQWEGERTFSSRSESCPQLARAMALATAIQLQLLAGAEAASPPPTPAPAAAPPPVVIAQDRPVVLAPPPPPRPADERPIPPAVRPASPPGSREPVLTADVGVGAIRDFGDGPTFVVPRIALTMDLRSAFGLRLAASGLGPGVDVTRAEGVARLDRLVITLALVRFFRAGRIVQPMVAVGGGLQSVHAQGTSAMPDVALTHQGRVFSGLIAASGGLAFAIRPRLALVVEVEMLLFQPSVTVEVGSSKAAYLDGAALYTHGGLLARF